MSLASATRSARCNQPTTYSEIDTCEDNALFLSDRAMLYVGSGSPMLSDCTETLCPVQIQNDQGEGGTDDQVPMCPTPSITSGFQDYSCQYPGCAVDQLLYASQCRTVICLLPCAPNAEHLKLILQGGSLSCSAHASGNAEFCLQQNIDTCLHFSKKSEHADQDFYAAKSDNRHDYLPDGTLDPCALNISAGTSNMPQQYFKCDYPGCKQYFKRQRTLDRHLRNHLGERLHVCWVPGCQRSFSRSDNLKAHYITHGTFRGRNRYVATLDKTNPVYDPKFRGQLTSQGWPIGDATYD